MGKKLPSRDGIGAGLLIYLIGEQASWHGWLTVPTEATVWAASSVRVILRPHAIGREPSAASKRYLRVIRRLKAILDQVLGFFA